MPPKDKRDMLRLLSMRPAAFEPSFPEARAFVQDKSRLKVVLCTRRAAKSFTAGRMLYQTATFTPGCNVLYCGLTRESAKRVICKDILDPLNDELCVGAHPNKTDLTYTLPNRSVIYVLGMDASADEMKKVFGQKFALVVIDEAALYTIDLRELIYATLKPTTIDMGGSIVLMGMPGNNKRGLFYDLTAGQKPTQPGQWQAVDPEEGAKWSGHRWSAHQNPHVKERFEEDLAKDIADNPHFVETTRYRQVYLGEWVTDKKALVYDVESDRNLFDELPSLPASGWHYVLGIDLGFNDPTALVVAAYHDYDRCLYFIEARQWKGLIISEVVKHIQEFNTRYEFDATVIDGANKQAVEEINSKFGTPLQNADKTGKVDFIALMNDDYVLGKVKMQKVACAGLFAQAGSLIWKENAHQPWKARAEKPGSPNDLLDAALYAYRHCYPWLSAAPVKRVGYGEPGWEAQHAKETGEAEEHIFDTVRQRHERSRQTEHDFFDAAYEGFDSGPDPYASLREPS